MDSKAHITELCNFKITIVNYINADKRKLTAKLLKLAGQYPAVSLIGPRQAGKTTLTRLAFDQYNYLTPCKY